jgi:hypothetical protein
VSRIWHEPDSLASVEKISLSLCHKEEDGNIFSFNEIEKGTRKWGWGYLLPQNTLFVCIQPDVSHQGLIFLFMLGMFLMFLQQNGCSRPHPMPLSYRSILDLRLSE